MTRYTRNRLERKRDVGCRLKATVGTFLETMPDDAFQRGSDRCWHATEFDRIFVENRVQRFNRGGAMERAAAGQHVVKYPGKRKDVGAVIDGASANLFRRHVTGRAHDRAWVRVYLARCEIGRASCRERG